MWNRAALEKQNQMVVKYRTGKPKSGISVFSGSPGASTLLFVFGLLSSSLFFCCLGFGGGISLPLVSLAGLYLEALLKPQLLGHSLITTSALKGKKKDLTFPVGEKDRVEGSHVSQACPELGK